MPKDKTLEKMSKKKTVEEKIKEAEDDLLRDFHKRMQIQHGIIDKSGNKVEKVKKL